MATSGLPLGGTSGQSNDIVDYLAGKLPQEYKSVAVVSVSFHPFMGMAASTTFRSDGAKTIEIKDTNSPAEIELPGFLGPLRSLPENRPTSESTLSVSEQVGNDKALASAAIAYRDLNRKGQVVANVTLDFQKEFLTEDDLRVFLSKNQALKLVHSYRVDGEDRYTAYFSIPSAIKKAFIEYWNASFRSSRVFLTLDNPAYLMLSCDASVLDTYEGETSVGVHFKATSEPKIEVGTEEGA